MIDLHTHILPGVDDGAEDLKISLEIAREASRQGISKVIATPHYLEEGYQLTPAETEERVEQLQRAFQKEGIEIELLPGAEVYLTPDLGKKVDKGMVPTLNDTSFILIEFPHDHIPGYVNDVFFDLKVMGYTPVICHPERYKPIIKHPNYLYHWVEEGVYAQVNASSLIGVFGSRVKQTAELLVKNNLVQLIGSDVHSTNKRRECLQDGVERLRQLIGPRADTYLKNAQLLIEDRELEVLKPQKQETKGVFGKIIELIS